MQRFRAQIITESGKTLYVEVETENKDDAAIQVLMAEYAGERCSKIISIG